MKTIKNHWCPVNMHNHHEYGNFVQRRGAGASDSVSQQEW